MKPSVIVWDLETVPDLAGFAAAKDLVGKRDTDIRPIAGRRAVAAALAISGGTLADLGLGQGCWADAAPVRSASRTARAMWVMVEPPGGPGRLYGSLRLSSSNGLPYSEFMTDNQPPLGQRFSHVYAARGQPTQDSRRMRRRLASSIENRSRLSTAEFTWKVPHELGVDLKWRSGAMYGDRSPDWIAFCRECELKDLLDLITLVRNHLHSRWRDTVGDEALDWCHEVRRTFEEENVHYTVDDRGGVHFRYDAEFEHNRAATISSLQGSRYRSALNEFEGAMVALGEAPPDTKKAIRDTFSATENLFKLMFPKSPRLAADEVQKLEPLLQRLHASDDVARRASVKLLAAFKDWTDGAHFYRHEAGREEPTPPPLALAVHMVSVGASFIRYLAELDAAEQRSG